MRQLPSLLKLKWNILSLSFTSLSIVAIPSSLAQQTDTESESAARVQIRMESSAQESGFQFPTLAEPSDSDAGNVAKVTVIDGQADRNSAAFSVLTDGRLPSERDQPSRNYFFGGRGGTLMWEWDTEVSLQAIRIYSRHPGMRRQQRWHVWVPDGERDWEQRRAQTREQVASGHLASAGWQKLGTVDTRDRNLPADRPVGTELRLDDADGMKLKGLLLQVECPDPDDRQSNTFLSEIDLIDGKSYPLAKAEGQVDSIKTEAGHEIVFDTTDLPEIREWVNRDLKPACREWYPRIARILASEGFTEPQKFTICFHRDMQGVAYTQGRDVHCAGVWFQRNLNGEAKGAVIHELVHVVQQYRRGRRRQRSPGWLVEGVADYVRWFLYEPESQRPRVNFRRANYDDSYRTSAAFLDFVIRNHDSEALAKFNQAMREGRYSDELWEEWTGKTAAELWTEFRAASE